MEGQIILDELNSSLSSELLLVLSDAFANIREDVEAQLS